MGPITRLVGSVFAAGFVAVVVGYVYTQWTLMPVAPQAAQQLFYQWAVVSTAISYVVAVLLLWWVLDPVARAISAVRSGSAPSSRLLTIARARTLSLPVWMGSIAFASWLLAAASLPPYFKIMLPAYETDMTLLWRGTLSTLLVGTIASGLIFSIADWSVRCHFVPLLFADGNVSGARGVTSLSLRLKMVLILVDACLVPIATLTVQRWLGDDASAMLLIGGSFFALGVFQIAFAGVSIAAPVAEVAAAMDRVAAGDHAVRVRVASADEVGRLGEGFNRMVEALGRAEFVKDTFGRYVSRQVLDEILGGKIHLGGERRTATVLFSDIRGFTSLSEESDPTQVVAFLNEYLTIMVDVLVEHGGTIDKFIGDAIMASFGVPISKEDDARRAVRAALAMLSRLEDWNRTRLERGEAAVDIGIGLHTGEVVAGNIGSAKKMEYTVIGDTVNTSSRIEQLNKQLGTRLLISAETYELVRDLVEARRCEPVSVKGKAAPLQVYEVTGAKAA